MSLRPANRRTRRKGARPARGSALLVVAALAGANYLLFFGGNEDAPAATSSPAEDGARSPGSAPSELPLTVPAPAPGGDELDDFGQPVGRTLAGSLGKGQTILAALSAHGVDSHTALPVVRAMEEVFDFRQAQAGDQFEARLDDEGQLLAFTYTQSPLDVYDVRLAPDGAYQARKKAIATRVDIAKVGCAVKQSLYESIVRCGEAAQLGGSIIDLFAWDMDFFQDVRKGDEFRVIIEKISVDGKFIKYGRVLAAEYSGKLGRHRLVHYTNPEGQAGYFTPDGRAARKDFLKSPLKYTRVSAGPGTGAMVAGDAHKTSPVVYTAQEGTPVWAVSGGTIVQAGDQGSLGTTVTIRHDNGYTSTYAHLGKLGRAVKAGALVNQKTVIGYVGKTGQPVEPRLLFGLRKGGRLVNPLKMTAAESDPVAPEHRQHFEATIDALLKDLEATPIVGVDERRS